jgi:hypothetical protein
MTVSVFLQGDIQATLQIQNGGYGRAGIDVEHYGDLVFHRNPGLA